MEAGIFQHAYRDHGISCQMVLLAARTTYEETAGPALHPLDPALQPVGLMKCNGPFKSGQGKGIELGVRSQPG